MEYLCGQEVRDQYDPAHPADDHKSVNNLKTNLILLACVDKVPLIVHFGRRHLRGVLGHFFTFCHM